LDEASLTQALQAGLAHQRAGRLPQAEQIYRQVLGSDPRNAEALHLLGTLAHQVGKHEKAVELIEQALALRVNPTYLNNLGNALKALGRHAAAETRYRQALSLQPAYAHAEYNLAVTCEEMGRPADAEAAYRRAVAAQPDLAEAHYNLGNLLQRARRYAESRVAYEAALGIRPQHAEAHNNLGNALKALGRAHDAEEHYRQALASKPDYAVAHYNLGAILHDAGKTGEAQQCYRTALAIDPGIQEGHYNLGNLLYAAASFADAAEHYARAAALRPEHSAAHYNLGTVLQALGRLPEAEHAYGRALALNPEYAEARCMRAYERQHLCLWDELDAEAKKLRQLVRDDPSAKIFPFTFLALPESTADEQHRCAQQFARIMYGSAVLESPPVHRSRGRAHKALRIGYLSGDYHQHATSFLLAEIIEQHSRRHFHVSGYSYGKQDESAIGKRIRGAFDVMRDVRGASDEDAARMIAEDEIDILIDLKGYTAHARAKICAYRPAPVQVSWLGYPGTLGEARLADYLIADPIVAPRSHAAHFAEKLALLPNCYQPNDRQRKVGEPPSRDAAGLPAEGFVFCCFNQSYKITPRMFDLWCRLLRELPGSVLWLLQTTRAAKAALQAEAAKRGITEDRLVFAPAMPQEVHLGRLQLADLALDTFPVTSHTTASDALWAGLPLVTFPGETFVSRVAASVLTAGGLPELVAADADAYYRLAKELATAPAELKKLRAKLVRNRDTCPLFDSKRFVRDLEELYQRMWADHLAGRREPIALGSGTG
jgi:predicted O-linked N-acetylglucosamine transferase (SPINDLY family)